MRQLIVIDDSKIRRLAFAEAEKILKKVDRLEVDIESFHGDDQRLFANWFELTFRDENAQIQAKYDELRQISIFHNWIIAESELSEVSMPEAYVRLRAEEKIYRDGTDDDRAWIDTLRRQRDVYIRSQVGNDYRRDEDESVQQDRDDENLEEDVDDLGRPNLTDQERAELRSIGEMADKKIRKICEHPEPAHELLSLVLELMRTPDDFAILLRVWEHVPPKIQNAFAKGFSKAYGFKFQDLLADLKGQIDQVERRKTHHRENESAGQDDRASVGSARKAAGEHLEGIKLLYRKLVRKLHPDMQDDPENQARWQKTMWVRVQDANQRQDRSALEKLYRLVLIRSRSFSDLTIGEILESQKWLQDELENLGQESKRLKRLPSWRFSKRKNYETLLRKFRKSLESDKTEITLRIADLKHQHSMMESMANEMRRERPSPRRRPKKRKSARR